MDMSIVSALVKKRDDKLHEVRNSVRSLFAMLRPFSECTYFIRYIAFNGKGGSSSLCIDSMQSELGKITVTIGQADSNDPCVIPIQVDTGTHLEQLQDIERHVAWALTALKTAVPIRVDGTSLYCDL